MQHHGLTGISQMLFRICNPELNYLAFGGFLNIDFSKRRILLVKNNNKGVKPD